MISEAEYQQWRQNEVTKELLELLKLGHEQALNDLLAARGEPGDFQRGASLAYSEIAHIVRTGENLFVKE
jgi:hypothetical protein